MKAIAKSTQNNSEQLINHITTRESMILELIAEGLSSREIASQLFISPLTVNTHRKNMLSKFKATNTASLIRLAFDHKILRPKTLNETLAV